MKCLWFLSIFFFLFFDQCVFPSVQSSKEVIGLNVLLCIVCDEELIGKKVNEDKIKEINSKKDKKSRKVLAYKIIYADGTFEEKKIYGRYKELASKEHIDYVIKNILDIFDKDSDEELNIEVEKNSENLKKVFKEIYIEENKENWKEEYFQKNNKKMNIKNAAIGFLGFGLGVAPDRYMKKK